jgi:hypothetical protein
MIFLFVLSCIVGITGMHHHTQPLVEMGLANVFALAGMVILSISAS